MSIQDRENKDGATAQSKGRTLLGVRGSATTKTLQLKTPDDSSIRQAVTGTSRSSVVVVTKGRTKVQDSLGSLTEHEKSNRLAALQENVRARDDQEAQEKSPALDVNIGLTAADDILGTSSARIEENESNDISASNPLIAESTEIVQEEIESSDSPEDKGTEHEAVVEAGEKKESAPSSVLSLRMLRSQGKIRSLDYRKPREVKEEGTDAAEVSAEPIEASAIPSVAIAHPLSSDKKKRKLEKEDILQTPPSKSKILNAGEGRAVARTLAVEEESERIIPKVKGLKARKNNRGTRRSGSVSKVVREVLIPDILKVQELANRMAEKVHTVIKALATMGVSVTPDQEIDAELAELVVLELGHKAIKKAKPEDMLRDLLASSNRHLQPRGPVVTVMGHVDHGKTSLLDALRESDVAAGEHGGITQHIGAYQVKLRDGRSITFLDTPGHEAFTALRLRGAKVTDIVVLVVAADDGIMAQTVEAINHAKAAQVPIIVAVNKIDRSGANFEAVKNSLFQYQLIPDDMGGDVMVVGVSAKNKTNLDKLEEAILMQAELLELQADYSGPAKGYIIEAKVDKNRGVTASLLLRDGTLKQGDMIVAGSSYGKVRGLVNDKGEVISKAEPAAPIEVLGLDSLPMAGDEFVVVDDEKVAKQLVAARSERDRIAKLQLTHQQDFAVADIFNKVRGNDKELKVVFKADAHGSVDAIAHSLKKLDHPEVQVKVLHSGVGGITESDVTLAASSGGLLFGFNVRANNNAKLLAQKLQVEIKYYSIIYSLIDELKAKVSGLLSPIVSESVLGYAEVRQVFSVSKVGKIAGCYVTEGVVKRNAKARLLRDNTVIYEGKLTSLKRQKDDAKEVKTNFECGISLDGFDDIQTGDVIEAFESVSEQRVL